MPKAKRVKRVKLDLADKTAKETGLSPEKKSLLYLGIWAMSAIVFMVFLILWLLSKPGISGAWVYAGMKIQYEPYEACEVIGCKLVETPLTVTRNPYLEPTTICDCDGVLVSVPLIQSAVRPGVRYVQ